MGMYEPIEVGSRSQRTFTFAARLLGALKLDGPLLIGLGLITVYGFVILYSASGQSWNRVADAAIRACLGELRDVRARAGEARVPAPPRAAAVDPRRRAARGRRHHRPHRQGRAALARSRIHPLPA